MIARGNNKIIGFILVLSLMFLNSCQFLQGNIHLEDDESQAVSRVKNFDVPIPQDVIVEARYYVDDYGWFMEGPIYYVFSFSTKPTEVQEFMINSFDQSFKNQWDSNLETFNRCSSKDIKEEDIPTLEREIFCLSSKRYERKIRNNSGAFIGEEYTIIQTSVADNSEIKLDQEWYVDSELLSIYVESTQKMYSFVLLF